MLRGVDLNFRTKWGIHDYIQHYVHPQLYHRGYHAMYGHFGTGVDPELVGHLGMFPFQWIYILLDSGNSSNQII